MEIGPFISNLLHEHEKVDLRGFGQFGTKYIPARFLPEEKKIEAPRKQISFDPNIKEGESLLHNYISQVSGVTPEQADISVQAFVNEIINSLDQGKRVKLEQIGIFEKRLDGGILFEPDVSVNYLAETTGMGSVKGPVVLAQPESSQPESEMESEPQEVPVENKDSDGEKNADEMESAIEKETKDPGEDIPIKKPSAIKSTDKEPPTKTDERKKKKKVWPWIFLLFVIIAVVAFFVWPNLKDQLFAPKPAPTEEVTDEPQPEPEPEPVSEPKPEPEVVKPVVPPSRVPAYFIVVASFPDEESADTYAARLRRQGATHARVFMMAYNDYHRVSYDYFHDRQEAEAKLEEVRQKVTPEAYIFRHVPW